MGTIRYVGDTAFRIRAHPARGLRRPAESFVDQAHLDAEWQRLNYTGRPDYAGAQSQYDRLVSLLREQGSEIDFLPADPALTIDSIYVRDATIVGPRG